MTLILNAATQGFVVHASDRLLTKKIGGKTRVHSDTENKSLIVIARDAICLIGYTGSAYIDKTITDEWLASTIIQSPQNRDFAVSMGSPRNISLNTLLWRLEQAMRSAPLPPSARYLGVSISGIRIRRKRVRSFIREIERNGSVTNSSGYMRSPKSPGFHGLSQLGDTVSYSMLMQTIGAEFDGGPITAEAFRKGMVQTIRAKSRTSKLVGNEITSIIIVPNGRDIDVTWYFDSDATRKGALIGKDGAIRNVFDGFYSPWIISPGMVAKPSFGNGHFDRTVGNVQIRCGVKMKSRPGKNPLFAISSQRRAKP